MSSGPTAAEQRRTPSTRAGPAWRESNGPGRGRPRSRASWPSAALPERAGDVAAVERQQRDEVEDEQRDVQRRRAGCSSDAALICRVGRLSLAATSPANRPMPTTPTAVGVARRAVDVGLDEVDHPRGQRAGRRRRSARGARDDAGTLSSDCRWCSSPADAEEPDGLGDGLAVRVRGRPRRSRRTRAGRRRPG